jgi:hypothetical protein
MLAYFEPPVLGNNQWRKPLVGTAFGIVCVLGIFAGVFPSKCSSTFHFRRVKQDSDQNSNLLPGNSQALLFRGHHPNCGNFGPHIFRVGNVVLCAGCVGLVIGAAVSVVGVAVFFFGGVSCWPSCYLVFWVGFLGASCGLLQYHLFSLGRSSIHLFVNAFFVFGVFLLLLGVDAILQNAVIDFYLVTLSLFWVYTRIMLSQFDHWRICAACAVEECELFV